MHLHDSRANTSRSNSNNSFKSNTTINSTSNCGGSLLNKNRQDNDGKSATAMSNLSSYSLIDDDHIDDQETINVGNLIIDLESDLEKEKIENEQQANAKSTKCSTTTSAPSSTFGTKSSSSTVNASTTNINSSTTTTVGGKSNQKTSNKHSNISLAIAASNNSIGISSTGGGGTSSSTISAINSSTNSSVNNSNNGSSSVNNTNSNTSSSSNNSTAGRTLFKSDERGDLKMRITRETKPGKSEHKIVTSPNQKSPTSSSGSLCISNNSTGHSNSCDDQDSIAKPSESSSISSTKECGTSTSVGTITEPECLGPCEPGTSVTLEGIVWQETEGGILVVNVTWRGKTYVGALLDCTKHDWAPPRLCDSPASDIDSKTHKGVRTKRIVTRSNGIGLDEKNLLQTTGKLRNGKGRRILSPNELASCNKRQRESEKSIENIAAQSEANASIPSVSSISNSETTSVPMNVDTTPVATKDLLTTSNILTDKVRSESPTLIGCSEPNCSKKYRNVNGLLYHQAHAHSADSDISVAQESCSSSYKEKSKNDLEEDLLENQKEVVLEAALETGSIEVRQDEESKSAASTETKRTPSPQLSMKMGNKFGPEIHLNHSIPINTACSSSSAMNFNNILINPDHRLAPVRNQDIDKRGITSSNLGMTSSLEHRKSPGYKHSSEFGHGSNNHSSSKMSSSSSKMSNPAPLPITTEEGMKPSGTSTGPPPAPHQQNCYFNPHFLANTLNPYALSPYFPRSPLPMYDPLAPPTSTANAAFLSRFMNNIRVPAPPESPSRLLNPSVGKNLPFPPYKVDPSILPNPQMTNSTIPNMSSLTHPPLATGSPHLRMPSQNEPMLPPSSQPPYSLPAGLNPVLGLPGSVNLIGPMGGPQVPSLVDDSLAKQFPRRFN